MATVRYVSDSDGVRVRRTPGGSIITTLFYGNLMYEIPYNSSEAQAGWIKVHYYLVGTTVSEGEGWVASAYTTVISSTNYPHLSDTISNNTSLTQYQQLINAWFIYLYLIELDWSSNAIYAMLGNMEAESTINPGKWEVSANPPGYGLTQWTPSTKLTIWAESNGYEKSSIDTQLKRIEYEIVHGEQWSSNLHSPAMSFVEFYQSTKSVATLAEYFVRCYENPASVTSKVPVRQANAQKWCALLSNLV